MAISADRGWTYRFGEYLGATKTDAGHNGAYSRIVTAWDGSFLLLTLRWADGHYRTFSRRIDLAR